MAEITKELGRIPISRGDYQATTEYYKDNIVQYKRGSYQVVSESPIIGVPPTNDKNVVNPGWTLFAGTLDAQDVVNQIKEQEAKSIQAVAAREAEILAKSDAAEVSFDNTGTSFSGTNMQDALEETDGKISELEACIGYSVCASDGNAQEKTINIQNFKYSAHCVLFVKFNNQNTADNVTLNINGTGAKTLVYNDKTVQSNNSWIAGETLLVYATGGTTYFAWSMNIIEQALGSHKNHTMSQWAIREAINTLESKLNTKISTDLNTLRTDIESEIPDISPEVVEIIKKLETTKVNPLELFDKDGDDFFEGYFSGKFVSSPGTTRTLFIPCNPSSVYTVSVKDDYCSRFYIGSSSERPTNDVVVNELAGLDSPHTSAYGRRYYKVTTKSNASYLSVFYYIKASDIKTEEEIRNTIMIVEGDVVCDYIDRYKKVNIADEHKCNPTGISFGTELADGEFAIGSGWSGDSSSGYTHTSGSGDSSSITKVVNNLGEKLYKVEVDVTVTDGTDMSDQNAISGFGISIGSSIPFEMYEGNFKQHTYIRAIKACGGTEIKITALQGSFRGTITRISVKEVLGNAEATHRITDSEGGILCEIAGNVDGNNVYFGKEVAINDFAGHQNVAIGVEALKDNGTGFWNEAIGFQALRDNTNGSRNVAIGYVSLVRNQSGHRNVAIGPYTMDHNINGNNNIAIGPDAMRQGESAVHNVALGTLALEKSNAKYSIAIGSYALANANIDKNIAIGYEAFSTTIQGSWETIAIGHQTLKAAEKARESVFIGNECCKTLKNGTNNVVIGHKATLPEGTNNTVKLGNNATETLIIGNKKINFNEDGSVTWEYVVA